MSKSEHNHLGLSPKHQLVLAAERLFALHGLDGVSLRQIGVAAGMANTSAVQYHFGTKDALVEAILLNRLEHLSERRTLLAARTPLDDIRHVVEAHELPLIELAEDAGCFYLPFLEQLVRYGGGTDPLDKLPVSHRDAQQTYYELVGQFISNVPPTLRDRRIAQTSAVSLHVCADRHRDRMLGKPVAPYAVHVSQLLDSLVALLTVPLSDETVRALSRYPSEELSLRLMP